MQPLPVHGEVDEVHGARHPQPSPGPKMTGELSGEMEDGHHHIGVQPLHQFRQPGTPLGRGPLPSRRNAL